MAHNLLLSPREVRPRVSQEPAPESRLDYATACARARDITRIDATWNEDTTGGGPHPQGTHTEGRTPQRTHHQRGGPHRGPTQNTHRHRPCAEYDWSLVEPQPQLKPYPAQSYSFFVLIVSQAGAPNTVESRIGPKRGFGLTPGELLTISKTNPYPKSEKFPWGVNPEKFRNPKSLKSLW